MEFKEIITRMRELEDEQKELSRKVAWVTVYPGEEEEEKIKKLLIANDGVCIDPMLAISNWDGYGELWAIPKEKSSIPEIDDLL